MASPLPIIAYAATLVNAVPIAVSIPINSYWCFQCNDEFHALVEHAEVRCPQCHAGLVQLLSNRLLDGVFHRLLVLRKSDNAATEDGENRGNYEIYYDNGDGFRLLPVPAAVLEYLLGSESMLDLMFRIGFDLWIRKETLPASENAIDSLPTLEISQNHVDSNSHCAVCTDVFELGSEVREMPCKHIYHFRCIFTWLTLHNSCPICRVGIPNDYSEWSEMFIFGKFVVSEMETDYSELARWLNLEDMRELLFTLPPPRRSGRLRRFIRNLRSVFGRNRRERG